MGGSDFDEEWQPDSSNDATTIVLVGKIGYGKSATGNSILGKTAFESKPSFASVTSTCEIHSTSLKDNGQENELIFQQDGRILNVIDTPGLFTWSGEPDRTIGKEIVKCMGLAKDGIHAVVVVFSLRFRFSDEEKDTIEKLKKFFGERIINYLVIVFTSADILDEDDMKMKEFHDVDERNEMKMKKFHAQLKSAPEPLQSLIKMCKDRVVPFNNKTDDEAERNRQLELLLSHIDSVAEARQGKPFFNKIILALQKGAHAKEKTAEALKGHYGEHMEKLKKEMQKTYEDHLEGITKKVEEKLNQMIEKLTKELNEEKVARLKSDEEICKLKKCLEKAQKETNKRRESDDRIRELKESLEKAQEEAEELKKAQREAKQKQGACTIL